MKGDYPSPSSDGSHSRTTTNASSTNSTPPPSSSSSSSGRGSRHRGSAELDEEACGGDPIKCTGKSCKSCTAGLIADCVAVCCCCPCAVVNILVFTLLKVPWMVGRRILRRLRRNRARRKKKKRRRKKKCCGEEEEEEEGEEEQEWEYCEGRRRTAAEMGAFSEMGLPEFGDEYDEELRNGDFSARFEADQQLWFELHQFGHLGFGRVSFTGIQMPCG